MQYAKNQARQAALNYKAALEETAQAQEGLASYLAIMADELDRQGQSKNADMLQQASRHHRAATIKRRAIAASGAYG